MKPQATRPNSVLLGLLAFVAGFKTLGAIGSLALAIGKLALAFGTAGNAALIAQGKMALIGIAALAAIAVVLLLIEDLFVLFTGGESLIGRLLERWQAFVDAFLEQPITAEESWPVKILRLAIETLEDWKAAFGVALDFFTNENKSIITELGMLWTDLFVVPVKSWISQLLGFTSKAIGILGKVPGLRSILGGALGPIGAAVDSGLRAGQAISRLSGQPETTFLGNTGGGAITNTSNVNAPITINQRPGEDGEALARRVDQTVRDVLTGEINSATAALTPQVAPG